MTADDTVTRAAEVMIAHTRTSIEACHCGWGRDATELGRSHAEHVARALADAGLLTSPDRDREVAAAEVSEWADHFETVDGAVGPEPLTVQSIIAAMRGPRPFGKACGIESGEHDE